MRERLLKLTTRFSHCIKESCVVNEVNEILRLRVVALCLGSLKLMRSQPNQENSWDVLQFIGRFTIWI